MLVHLVRRYAGRYKRRMSLVVVLLAVQAVANLYLPNLTADIINNGVAVGNLHYIWRTGAIMLGITLVVGAVAIVAVYFASMTSMGIGRDIREALFKSVQRFSAKEMNHLGTPSLITRNTNDVQQIQLFLQVALTVLVLAPIMCIGGIIMALKEDVRLSSLLIVVIPLMAAIIGILLTKAVPLFQSMQVKIDRINLVLREQITGVRVIRAFVRTNHETERFAQANADLTATGLSVNRMFAVALPSIMGVLNLTSVAVIWFGGHLIDSGRMPIGNLVAFLSYILQILMSVLMAVMMVILVPRAVASAERIEEVLNTEPDVVDLPEPVVPSARSGIVEFKDVGFGYPGGERLVLNSLSFALRPGDTTAIIGGTGSGKTTLLNLVPRLFDTRGSAGEDDRAVLARQHALCRLLRNQKSGKSGDGERLLDLGRIELDEGPAGAVAGIVNDHVGRSERGFDVGEKLDDVGLLCRVAGKGLAADFLGKRGEIGCTASRQRHLHPGFRESPRHRGGKSAADTYDNRRPIPWFSHVSLPLSRKDMWGADVKGQGAKAGYRDRKRARSILGSNPQSTTAIALISTRQRGSVASRTTCTVVVAGLASPKYSPQTRLSASWSVRSVTNRSAVTTSAKRAPTASSPRLRFSKAARACPAMSRGMASNSTGRCGW